MDFTTVPPGTAHDPIHYDRLLHDKLTEAALLRAAAFARQGIDPLRLAQLSREQRRLAAATSVPAPEELRHYRAVVKEIELAEPYVRAALAELFGGPAGAVRVTGLGTLSEAQRAAVGAATAFVASVTPMAITVHLAAPVGRIREAYDPITCTLLLAAAGSSAETIVHELGHGLEHQAASIDQIALRAAFYAKRTAAEAPVPLMTLTGNLAYHPTEHTKRDSWLHPYIGKLYADVRASEIVSMGLQLLYSNPVLLADDLEHLDFMYLFLRGAYE